MRKELYFDSVYWKQISGAYYVICCKNNIQVSSDYYPDMPGVFRRLDFYERRLKRHGYTHIRLAA